MPILCIECPKEATIRAAVIGGPVIHFCADHAVRFRADCAKASVTVKTEPAPLFTNGAGR